MCCTAAGSDWPRSSYPPRDRRLARAAAASTAGAVARGTTSTRAATTTPATAGAAGACDVATANLHAAPVADVHVDLVAVIAADLPAEERGVERGLSLGIGDLHREVIEQNRLPTGRLERRLERHLATRGARVSVSAGASALSKRARERHSHRGEAECLEQVAAGDRPAIVRSEQSGDVVHRDLEGWRG